MKTLILIFLITINFSIYAQESIFVRVYNLSGIKISSGNVFNVTDTSLQLRNDQSTSIPISSIGYIKTKRSEGNNILIGSIIGGSSLAILLAATAPGDDKLLGYSAGEGAVSGLLLGAPIGAGIGGLGILLKKPKSYSIEGDLLKWKVFQLMLTENIVK